MAGIGSRLLFAGAGLFQIVERKFLWPPLSLWWVEWGVTVGRVFPKSYNWPVINLRILSLPQPQLLGRGLGGGIEQCSAIAGSQRQMQGRACDLTLIRKSQPVPAGSLDVGGDGEEEE